MVKSSPRLRSSREKKSSQATAIRGGASRRQGSSGVKKSSKRAAAKGRRSRRSPLARAEAILEKAFAAEYVYPEALCLAAERALRVSRDCTDAWLILAEHVADLRQALVLCQQGVDAARRAVNPELLEEISESLWADPNGRTYLRAKMALAGRLWELTRRSAAITQLEELLQLDPDDHQGVRYVLANRLIEEGRDDDLSTLLSSYDEDSTFWQFTTALAAFRREHDSTEARRLLAEARQSNPHVERQLLAPTEDLAGLLPLYSPGSSEEAMVYVHEFLGGWRQTPGAITWFRQSIAAETSKAKSRRLQNGNHKKSRSSDDARPALIRQPGISSAAVRDLHLAAAQFFGKAPWRKVPPDTAIQIDCDGLGTGDAGPRYAVVIGQDNLTLGLAVYESLDDLLHVLEGPEDPNAEINQRSVSLLFSEAFEMSPVDVAECVRNGWIVAGPEAYPLVLCAEGGVAIPPTPEQLELLTVCLRVVPDFIDKFGPFDEPAQHTAEVKYGRRTLSVTLSAGPELPGGCGESCGDCGDCESCAESCSTDCH